MMRLYVIYDRVEQYAGPIIQARNDNVANRIFNKSLEEHPHRLDFAMYSVGEFDPETMELTGCVIPRQVTIDSIESAKKEDDGI